MAKHENKKLIRDQRLAREIVYKHLAEDSIPKQKKALTPDIIYHRKRMKLLQDLDKSDKQQRVKNTEKFLLDFAKLLIEDFGRVFKGKKCSQNDLNNFATLYSIHVQILKKYDEEMVFCSNPTSTQSLTKAFEVFLNNKIPVLSKSFNLNINQNIKEV